MSTSLCIRVNSCLKTVTGSIIHPRYRELPASLWSPLPSVRNRLPICRLQQCVSCGSRLVRLTGFCNRRLTQRIVTQDAGSNAFVASLAEDTSTKMGIMHAIYGVGAMCAPLVSTQFARIPRWSFVYLVHIGLAATNALSQMVTFLFRRQEGTSARIV